MDNRSSKLIANGSFFGLSLSSDAGLGGWNDGVVLLNLLRLSFNLLRRDWRAGEWRVLMLALVLAVGSLSTVGLFADRVRQALGQQASSLLGADMRITSTRPISASYRKMAEARGLRAIESLTFPSMVSNDGQVLLSEIQSVEAGYPLRGKIEIDEEFQGELVGRDSSRHPSNYSIPLPGTVWADERLLRRLNLQAGDKVGIGAQHFVVAARIVKDVDQSVGFASFAPRVLMNESDLAATGLLQEGSRISYRLMVAGEAKQVAALRAALHLTNNEKLEDVTDARPEIRTALERAEHFMGLAALTAAILAGVAIALAARRYVVRHLDGCAVMRCLGAVQGQVLRLFLFQFLLAGLLAVCAGLLSGYAAQAVLAGQLMSDAALPQPGILPALQAALSGYVLLIGFAFLPLLQLRKVSPLRVIRRELGLPQMSGWLIYGLAVLVLAVLFLWQAGSVRLGVVVLGGLLAGLLAAGGLAWLLLQLLARYAYLFGSYSRHALNNLARNATGVAVQVTALSLGGMALLVLTLVKGDLLQSWQGKLPVDAPNRFVVNIQPDQRMALSDFFARQQLPVPALLPMVKGRLVAINERAIGADSYPAPRARSLVEREFNLSYSDDMPGWNTLVSGKWWSGKQDSGFRNQDSANSGQLSVEEGIAKTLGIRLGDTLTYDVAGSRFTATVTSLRRVQWDSMKVNFFVIGTPKLMQDYPASYLTSFYLPPGKLRSGEELVSEFSNLLLINTDEVIAQLRSIIDRVSKAVSVVFMFTLLSGLLVLYAAMLATEREHEAAILRTLGADSTYLRRLYLSEFAVIGMLSGVISAASSALLGWVLARYVLEIPYGSNGLVWLFGVSGGVLLVMLTGWLNIRRLGKIPPLRILRSE
ncbi:MAG: FtsX-like permease family protein [Gallionella sp.]|jgi:putative ABC transport system permease protein